MKKILQTFAILILALGFLIAPTSAEAATIPTEVERVKDYYYFKIHGGPWTPYPDYGKAEFIYKNLSTNLQDINVKIQRIWGDSDDFVEFPRKDLDPGQEWSSIAEEDFGVTVRFELYIDDSSVPEFSGTIWVPPPP